MLISIPLIAMAMGVLLSPVSLAILGNNMGIVGAPFLIFMLTALVIHLFTALAYGEIFSTFPGLEAETLFIKESLGPTAALVLPLCSRVLFTICAATAILAVAGYTINEVFVRWFPNLGFSYCLLGFLLLINFLGHRVSITAQIFFAAMTVLGLLLLSVVGLFHLGKVPPVMDASISNPHHMGKIVLIGLVLFVGFDLAVFSKGSNGQHPMKLIRSMTLGIVLFAAVLSLWGLVSMTHVSPSKLADTTVPHMVAARKIMGQNGRVLMGLVVLAGSCAAVNALLMAVSGMIAGMAKQDLLPSFLSPRPKGIPVGLILLGLGIAAMMAAGMAGKPELEIYTKAAIWFWLLNYATIYVSVLIMRRRNPGRFNPFQIFGSPVIPIIGFLTLLTGLAGLLWTAPEGARILKFISAMLVTVSIFALLFIRMTHRRGRPASS